MTDLNARRAQLESRLQELDARLLEIDATLDEPSPRDDEERATVREDDEVLEGVAQSGLQEIRMIQAALRRIDSGEYGDCQTCGEPISEKRLDLLPFTPFCRDCAQARGA